MSFYDVNEPILGQSTCYACYYSTVHGGDPGCMDPAENIYTEQSYCEGSCMVRTFFGLIILYGKNARNVLHLIW